MSLIRTGKDNYSSYEEFDTRTRLVLQNESELLTNRDLTEYPVNHPTVLWLNGLVQGYTLEYGCGFGRLSHVFKHCTEYVGVDIIPDRITHANKVYGNEHVKFYLLNECPNVITNCAFSVTVLQHLTLPQTIEALNFIHKHLQEGGLLFLWEACLLDITEEEANKLYSDTFYPQHMIPKPLSILIKETNFSWNHLGGEQFILTKK